MRDVITSAALVASIFSADVTIAYTGVPANVLVACFLGTYAAFSIGDKISPRRKMWGYGVACLIMGGAFTAIVGAVVQYLQPNLEMTAGLQAGMGAAVSFCTRFFLPWLADVIKEGKWLKWIPFVNSRGDNNDSV